MDIYEEMLLQIVDILKKHNRPLPDLTHKEAIDEIRSIVNKDNPHKCGNCRFLIFKDYEHHDGTCSITRLHRNFESPCVHEEEML